MPRVRVRAAGAPAWVRGGHGGHGEPGVSAGTCRVLNEAVSIWACFFFTLAPVARPSGGC